MRSEVWSYWALLRAVCRDALCGSLLLLRYLQVILLLLYYLREPVRPRAL
jgi:hypothetical protein